MNPWFLLTSLVVAMYFIEQYQATLARQGTGAAEAKRLAWQALCRSLLATNEFIYLE